MSNKLISVIMAVKDGEEFVSRTIDSILSQTYKNFEFIIVVNCSTDNTLKIIQSYKDKRIKILQSNICQLNYNLNLALSFAIGEYIARIDADDIAVANRFEKQVAVLEKNNYSVVGSNLIYIDENDKIIGKMSYPEHNLEIRKKIIYKAVLVHPSILCRREDLLKVGGYLGGKFAQDLDLWIRLMRDENIQFYNIQEPLIKYRIHSKQAKGNKKTYADVAGYMFREAIYSKSIIYFISAWIYLLKAILK